MSFFSDLFKSDMFMPHGQCFMWYPEVLWLHVISDVVITLAYFSIPIAIFYVLRKQKKIPFKWVYAMFGSFILLCGTTHATAIWVLWDPVYRLEGVIKALTAGVSIATAFFIIPLIPQFLSILAQMHDDDEK